MFVSANAGSGKTSLLANRVLSLLLHGTPPAKILCLTFTNAAAAEMSQRVLKSLGNWVMADDNKLIAEISKLTNEPPNAEILARARSLFAEVLEAPQGINIQTIHGFCQSLLRRFPLEAGISPHFSVMDGRSEQEALAEARLRLFNHARNGDETIQQSLDNLARTMSETAFNSLIREIISNKRKFSELCHPALVAGSGDKTMVSDDSPRPRNKCGVTSLFFVYSDEEKQKLRTACALLLQSDKSTDSNTGIRLSDWLARPESREELLDGYVAAFLTEKSEPRKRIYTKDALKDGELIDALLAEQQRVYEFEEQRKTAAIEAHTRDVLVVAQALLAQYEAIKRAHGWMDYDDLILTACRLLTRAGMSPWVLFKLDGGIDHILVDEAQDTSPEQWQIVDALSKEFFAGESKVETARSLFVVGDEKQSIYSFQGADVKELAKMQRYFSENINAAAKPVHHLSLTKSYRSTDAVLQAVDAVFSNPKARAGLSFDDTPLIHTPTRSGQAGHVEILPLTRQIEGDNTSPSTLLARQIAEKISGWIDSGEASAGEIMILLRSRTTLADKLVRALKRRGVPVAGSDRMRLNDNLAVKDLVALGQILLLPEDDLTLAACLKSPIFSISEEALFKLAYDRGKASLWQRLPEFPEFAESYEILVELRAKVDFLPPFELYSHLLDTMGARKKFLGRMGEECADPLDEFLQQALLYERAHPPSMQGFLHWLTNSSSEIKRDMEQARDAVRIMTVHGAKGLQAKIVILPDTVEIPREQDSLLWDGNTPIRAPSSASANKKCRALYAQKREETMCEYRRLLYVAMTRAEDRLYICGATRKEKISEESWYALVEAAMQNTVIPHLMRDLEQKPKTEHNNLRSPRKGGDDNLQFLQHPPPAEPTPSKPLTPSRPSEADSPASASPLSEKQVYAAGKYIHLLLQYLPMQPKSEWERIAKSLATKFTVSSLRGEAEAIQKASTNWIASSLAAPRNDELLKCYHDAISVIENPEFSFLFGADALAEVPITGTVEFEGKLVTVSGQIDRLYIGKQEAWIVDFKSNQRPPADIKNIPRAYIRQLALYRLLLQKIMPEKRIRCALLWTANARLDELD